MSEAREDMDTVTAIGTGTLLGAFVGAVAAAWKNSPKQAAVPISATLRGISGYAFFFGAAGGLYVGTVNAMTEFRSTRDPLNHLVGGALTGSMMGFAKRNLQVGVACAAFTGVGCAFADLVGNPGNRSERSWTKLRGIIPAKQE